MELLEKLNGLKIHFENCAEDAMGDDDSEAYHAMRDCAATEAAAVAEIKQLRLRNAELTAFVAETAGADQQIVTADEIAAEARRLLGEVAPGGNGDDWQQAAQYRIDDL